MAHKTKIGKTTDIPEGKMKEYRVEGKVITVANSDGEFMAFDGICTHEHCSLAGGFLDGYTLTCYCHGAMFDVKNGEVLGPPATVPLGTYQVTVEGEDIYIEI